MDHLTQFRLWVEQIKNAGIGKAEQKKLINGKRKVIHATMKEEKIGLERTHSEIMLAMDAISIGFNVTLDPNPPAPTVDESDTVDEVGQEILAQNEPEIAQGVSLPEIPEPTRESVSRDLDLPISVIPNDTVAAEMMETYAEPSTEISISETDQESEIKEAETTNIPSPIPATAVPLVYSNQMDEQVDVDLVDLKSVPIGNQRTWVEERRLKVHKVLHDGITRDYKDIPAAELADRMWRYYYHAGESRYWIKNVEDEPATTEKPTETVPESDEAKPATTPEATTEPEYGEDPTADPNRVVRRRRLR